MAYEIKKTEHAGRKAGRGAWMVKADAKKQASRVRRIQERAAIRRASGEDCRA